MSQQIMHMTLSQSGADRHVEAVYDRHADPNDKRGTGGDMVRAPEVVVRHHDDPQCE